MEAVLDAKEFQEIMDEFVEVHQAASQAVDVSLVLTDVKNNLEAGAKKYSEFLSGFLISCNNAKNKVDTFVKKLTTAQADAKNKIENTWNKVLVSAKKGIADSQESAKKTQAQLAAIHKQMKQIVEDYHVGVTETDAKIDVVKQLRDIIEDELLNPAGQKSFIQVGKFSEKLKKLRELIQLSGDTMYTPIIHTLVQLASEQNFSDQTILHTILKNLTELDHNLEKFKAEKEHDMNETLKNLKAQEENLTSQVQDYHHLEQRYSSEMSEAHQNIEVLQNELTTLASEITRKTDELSNVTKLCDAENEVFKSGTERMKIIRKDLDEAMNQDMDLHKK